jgi:hypothetical protein
MDITEFARLGGLARAKSLTRAQRVASAKKAIRARWAKRDALVTAKARRNAARRKLAA